MAELFDLNQHDEMKKFYMEKLGYDEARAEEVATKMDKIYALLEEYEYTAKETENT